jgi:hypothetical protein
MPIKSYNNNQQQQHFVSDDQLCESQHEQLAIMRIERVERLVVWLSYKSHRISILIDKF